MTKRLDEDAFRFSETAYDKAIRKMEEREAKILSSSALQQAASVTEQIRIQQAPFIQALQPFKDIMQPYQNLIKQNSLGLATTTASLSSVAKTVVPDDALSSITESVNSVAASMQSYRDIKDVLATFEAATITPELQAFQSQLKNNVQVMGNGLSAISDYIGELTLKWDNALALNDVLERSIAAQNFAVVRMLPNYDELELPRGSKKVLKALTKTTAKKLMQSDKVQFDPKEKDFYHKDSPDIKFSADQITVVESSLELFEEIPLDSLLSFESKLEQNYVFALQHPVGARIFEMLKNWNHFVSFEEITYYHARVLGEQQRPYHDSEMMKAPINVSAHGRYNEVGRSCYYISEDKEGALKEIYKHSGGTKPRVQVIGLNAIKSAKLLDLSGKAKKTNRFIEHMRFTVENEVGKTVHEYLLPNFVASCCKEIGIDGIRYRSTGYNCCVLWKDDYFEYAEGSREVIPE
ncbi:Uncharacterised protein [uncultured Clostridium sp.]|jgi:hypothetical protein|nr:uncharacterized protein BN537_01300 [Firmicutes bacterium CAG:212]SCH19154.1 Uncharacterised protein [uncultured Clostridium sp.]